MTEKASINSFQLIRKAENNPYQKFVISDAKRKKFSNMKKKKHRERITPQIELLQQEGKQKEKKWKGIICTKVMREKS